MHTFLILLILLGSVATYRLAMADSSSTNNTVGRYDELLKRFEKEEAEKEIAEQRDAAPFDLHIQNQLVYEKALYSANAAYDRGDYKTAFLEFKVLAEQGHASVQSVLGSMYRLGEGVPEDDRNAVKWYRRAAEQGYALAQARLGIMYATGEGVPEDDGEAVHWLRQAAEQGYAKAQADLGIMYAKGKGVPRDNVQAYVWTNLAAALGNETARENKLIIAKFMTPIQISEAQKLSKEIFEKMPQ